MAKGKYQEWRTPEGLLKIEGWARDGLTKLVYVHEGARPEKEGSAWKRLEGTKYFGGAQEGSEEAAWRPRKTRENGR